MNPIVMVVPSHIEPTMRAVESSQHQDIESHLVLVDNGSTDGCGAYLRSVPGCTLITYRPSRGLHHIWNSVLSYLFDFLKLEHALVVNNDVWLRPDTYRLLLLDNTDFVTAIGVGRMDQTEALDPTNRSLHPDFSCFLIKRRVWDQVGRFDESMEVYCGDADLHLRMHQAGIQASAIAVPFYHEVSGTIKRSNLDEQDRIGKIANHDREVFARKWGFKVGSDEYYEQFKLPNRYKETGRL